MPELNSPVMEMAIDADADDFRRASGWLERACLERGVPVNEIGRLDICVNEILANILAHGGERARSTPILLRFATQEDFPAREALVTVVDAGKPFNPLDAQVTERPRTLAEAEPGGLGLSMIRGSADSLSYRYLDDRNHLSVGVRWSEVGNG